MDVIREFVLRGRMEIMKADLAVPDISAFTKTMAEQNRLTTEIAGRVAELSDRYERAAAEREREAQAARKAQEDALKAADAAQKAKEEEQRQAEQAAEATRKAAEEAERLAAAQRKRLEDEAKLWDEVAAEIAATEKAKQDAINATNKAREEAIRRDKEINSALLKGGDGLKQMGDGAFTLARGFTLIGLEGSENLEAVARGVANVQGKFDLFRGGIDVIKGGVESARAFGEAFEKADGPIDLVKGRLAGMTAFLGPHGMIAAGAIAVGATIAGVFEAMREDIETETEAAERRLREFADRANMQAARAAGAFARADAIRDTLSGQQRIDAIHSDITGLGDRRTFNVMGEQLEREEAQKRIAELESRASNMAGGLGPGAAPSQSMIDTVKRMEDEKEALRVRMEVIDPRKREKEIADELKKEQERQKLFRELRSETQQRDTAADLLRNAGIDEANAKIEARERDQGRIQEELRRAEAQQKELLQKQAAERAGWSAPDRAFIDRISGNLRGQSDAVLDRVMRVAPENLGRQVFDERVLQGGGTPADRVDRVADLRAELADVKAELRGLRGNRDSQVAEDKKLEDQSRQSVESINTLLRSIATTVEDLTKAQAIAEQNARQLRSELQQANH